MKRLITISRSSFCDLNKKNRLFQQKMKRYQKEFNIHERVSKINDEKIAEYVATNQKQKIASQMAHRSSYDEELKDFIKKFNSNHRNQITLLDFTNYISEYGDLVNTPLRKDDLEVMKEFQKRKVDQRIAELKKNVSEKNKKQSFLYEKFAEYNFLDDKHENYEQRLKRQQKAQQIEENSKPRGFPDEAVVKMRGHYTQGPFQIRDHFMMLLLDVRINTKITTLNRISSYKTLIFMGNGNGIISYAKGRGITPSESLERAIYLCKKNVIAIPRDSRCTMPLDITKKFQDFTLELRSIPGFNAHGHPTMAFLLTLAGMDHTAFKVAHTDHNIYNVLNVMYKAVTHNTTPQELAEREGFKVYRHQFIRPLTFVRTHSRISR